MISLPRDIAARSAEIRRLIDEVIDADWNHPTWRLLPGGVALLEALGKDGPAPYIRGNGKPGTDTFMARMRPPPATPAEMVMDAIVSAHAALDALRALDGQFPDQPLCCYVGWRAGTWQPQPLGYDERRAVFVTAYGAAMAALGDAAGDVELARDLARFAAGQGARGRLQRIDTDSHAPTRAAVAVSLGQVHHATMRHLHRHAWTRGGGPWLGVGTSAGTQVVTTCHMVVDGYGHARLTGDIARRCDRYAHVRGSALVAAAGSIESSGVPDVPSVPGAVPIGLATACIEAPLYDFAALAHALGCALDEHERGPLPREGRERFTPTIHVAVAPGSSEDPGRWRRRVGFALVSVRLDRGQPEPLHAFRDRVRGVIADARAGGGLLMRLHDAVARSPAPMTWKRALMSSGAAPRPWMPPSSAFAGRGSLSFMRFAPGEEPLEPLYAASAITREAPPHDPGGQIVITVMGCSAGASVTLAGSGPTGTDDGARAFLERWLALARTHVRAGQLFAGRRLDTYAAQ